MGKSATATKLGPLSMQGRLPAGKWRRDYSGSGLDPLDTQRSHFTAPSWMEEAFTCPNCSAFSNMNWTYGGSDFRHVAPPDFEKFWNIRKVILGTSTCDSCGDFALWRDKFQVYPGPAAAPAPSSDMPRDISRLRKEAAAIAQLWPGGAAAPMRLAAETLLNGLGYSVGAQM